MFVLRNARYDVALRSLDPDMTRARLLLQKLHQYGCTEYACRRGLMTLPYGVRKMYILSLSSLLWNHSASYRIQEYGLQPVEGDLVVRERGECKGEISSR
jgi:tRNA pseudouridine13 synthase